MTFLFTDIQGSTRLWQLDPAAMRGALADHDEILRTAIAANEGSIFKTGGDSFCASFSSPNRALMAAVDAQVDLLSQDWVTDGPIRVRMGIHTGTAQVREGDYFGPTLNRTARIMSVGHGGQILCSSSTRRLLEDESPMGIQFESLGVHHLKDLDRPEEIFQVVAEGLSNVFPPLRSDTSGRGLADQAAEAYREKNWKRAVALFEHLESEQELTASQHEMMGFALWWLGEHDRVFSRLEDAYRAYLAEDQTHKAAITAVELADMHQHNLAPGLASGWISRASRLLAGDEDSVAKGYLLRWQAVHAFEREHDLEEALSLARRVGEIGRANSDGNLEVLSLQDQGRYLVASGRLDEGMLLMDEAMSAAIAGDVSPIVVGRSYCNMLAVCDKTGDLRRASEWSAAAESWCRESESSPYPGICRIFKAELLWLNGNWIEAESEIKLASTSLGLYTDVTGEAWYQYGVMRVRADDYKAAEEAFQEALANGREPVPGYAYVLAHKGETAAAADLINRSLAESSMSKLDRAPFLPALVEMSVELGDLETARKAVDELAEIAGLARSDFYDAQAAHARGRIELAAGATAAGVSHLRRAAKMFVELSLPYEAARARTDLARAYLNDGTTRPFAEMELRAALTAFKRLGSESDVAVVGELLGSHGV